MNQSIQRNIVTRISRNDPVHKRLQMSILLQ
jgi:hypothetical protein